jgi:hypothetical protein
MIIFPSCRPAGRRNRERFIAGTGANGALSPDAESVANAPLAAFLAYRVFSSLVPVRQEMVDNMPPIAGLFAARRRTDSTFVCC